MENVPENILNKEMTMYNTKTKGRKMKLSELIKRLENAKKRIQ